MTTIPNSLFYRCKSLFSVTIPHNVRKINDGALQDTYCLRKVAFPPNTVFGNKIFLDEKLIQS